MRSYSMASGRQKLLLVIVDYNTKWVEIYSISPASTPNIISKFWDVFCRWGFPKCIITDKGIRKYYNEKHRNVKYNIGAKVLIQRHLS
jgi:hypothetical protein